QETQPLRRQLSREKIDACRVAAWSGEVGDKTELDRVIADSEDDRNRRGCRSGGECRRRGAGRDDHGYPAADQIGHQIRKSIVVAFGRPDLDCNVLAQNITAFTKALMERGQAARRIDNVNKPDHGQRRLLRPRHERPRCRAAEKRDEIAPTYHSITSSARASSVAGTSRPSAFAVLRFMIISNLVGNSTGRSAGLSALRMRPA